MNGTVDHWLDDPAPQPRAVGDGSAAQRRRFEDLARQLEEAPVAAEPMRIDGAGEEPAAEAGPQQTSGGTDQEADGAAPGDRDPPDGRPGRPRGEIFENCPVKALGIKGDFCFYLDRHGQLRTVKEHKNAVIVSLFGDRSELLCRQFPTYAKNSTKPSEFRFDAMRATMTMTAACSERGLFDPDGAIRGTGAWTDDEGRLIYHTGRKLLVAGSAGEPREIDGKIYPAYPPIAGPAASVRQDDTVGREILAQIETWNWQRPEVEPMLALGSIGTLMLGGALVWRPFYWLTGDAASGKSTFQDLIRYLMGTTGLIQSSDPSKAGITSRLGHSSLPVALDEIEPGTDGGGKERQLIELARVAASGGQWLRGSADHKGAGGNVYSTFLFSSILIPGALKAQDRSRLIALNLNTLPKGAKKVVLRPKDWHERGARLKRLLIDRWAAESGTWATRLELWREALAGVGMTGRVGDNYATTIAMADMMLFQELPSAEVLGSWANKLARATRGDTEEIGSNADDMVQYLLGQPLDPYRRGQTWLLGQWLMVAGRMPAAPRQLILVGDDAGMTIDEQARTDAAKRANDMLAQYGLRVRGAGDEAEVFFPNQALPGLCRLFERSQWADGAWSQAAKRLPGATPVPQGLTLAGLRTRGVYVPFKSIPGLCEVPTDRAPDPAAAGLPDGWEDFA